jgi:hypothetical protein
MSASLSRTGAEDSAGQIRFTAAESPTAATTIE